MRTSEALDAKGVTTNATKKKRCDIHAHLRGIGRKRRHNKRHEEGWNARRLAKIAHCVHLVFFIVFLFFF
jgi:hypothetical protein